MRLLLISNSTNAGEEYLKYPIEQIGRLLSGVKTIVFVPYAAVTFSYDEYVRKVQARFDEIGIRVESVHRAADPCRMIRQAEGDMRRRRQHLRPDAHDAEAGVD